MTVGIAEANGVRLCYETFGDSDQQAMLLIMGLGVQMIEWEPEFCRLFCDQGFHVIRFDNRDVGLSTKFEGSTEAYTLSDMAGDAVGLLDWLDIDSAHVVGASMGAMIAQTLAIEYPNRVASLASIMSTPGPLKLDEASAELRQAMTSQRPLTRADVVADQLALARLAAGSGFPFDGPGLRGRAERAYDRAHYPAGRERQAAAIAASGDRTARLRELELPTVVIHGTEDPLIKMAEGQATAAAVPGSQLVLIEGMGHEFPIAARSQIVLAVARNARRVNRIQS